MLFLDLPGHGRSSGPTHRVRENAALAISNILHSILEELQVEQPVIVGWSLGGVVSLQYALEHESNVSALILVDSLPTARLIPTLGYLPSIPHSALRRPSKRSFPLRFQGLFIEKLLTLISKSPLRKVVAMLLVVLLATGKKPSKQLVAWTTKVLLKNLNIKAFFQVLSGMVEFDIIHKLSEITVPTLVIHGLEDRFVPTEYASLLHQNITNSKLKLFKGAGHCPQLEKPDEFNNTLMEFLDQIPLLHPNHN